MTRIFTFILFLFCSCGNPNYGNSGWQKVFKNDANGNTLFGDKSTLIDAVRLGFPIRIAWGGKRVEHVADADFLTIFEGKEVFAQTKTIVGQAPLIDGDSLKIRFREQNHWTKIAGSNGYSTGLMTDYITNNIVGGGTDRYAATTWFVQYPNHQFEIDPRPHWKDESPNWAIWEKEMQ